MTLLLNRRHFLASSLAAGATLVCGTGWTFAAPFKTTLHKALIVDKIEEETLRRYKAAGIEGVECTAWNVGRAEAEKARALADKCGMRIHSVLRGWTNFNDPAKLEEDVRSMELALETAQGYGADAVLMVPCKVSGIPMPEAWEFDIEFDPKTGHVSRVVKGDNAPYAQYIEAQNRATDVSREALKRLIPTAEKCKVVIGVENVWSNLWVKPALAAQFVQSFESPWVRFYLDIGNHVKYAKPEEWIQTLGKLIVKIHIKDFQLNPDGHGGKFVNIREGSVNWPAVREALDKIGYNGWMTVEGSDDLSLEEKNKRLDLIAEGK
ncbi:MAG TPA: sugar phosphate isomerase/epimerase family protein [Candidatus Sumerlaeota bacterium]|nr:sugar phosphate isomerase/epimerase family protein [Candidatus Sumerlaeota bacterium]